MQTSELEQFLEQRDDLLIHHPLLTGLALLPTSQIANLCSSVWRAVLTRQLGLCFTARSGMGKTSGMRYVTTFLHKKLPQLVVYNHSCRNHKGGSVRGFFKHFLTTVGHPLGKGETADLRDRLVKCIVDNARISGLQLVVMLIDEAQAMDMDDFTFLKDVANEVEEEGVALITVLMAQSPDFISVRNRLEHANRLDLISRFMLNQREFQPFDSHEDFQKLLAQVDKASFSETVPITWTEFFVPHAFRNGFRLENASEEIFSGLLNALKAVGLPCQIPARQLFAAVRIFLIDAMVNDSPSYAFDKELWHQSSNAAAILEASALAAAGKDAKGMVER